MTNEELNKLLNCEEMKIILKDIAVNNDFRMCLNKDVIKTYRYFFCRCYHTEFCCGYTAS